MAIYRKTATLLLLIMGLNSCATTKSNEFTSLKIYDIGDLSQLIKLNDRPIAVFIHADWCNYCRNMEQTTFKDDSVMKKLNEEFYFISFDGESEDEVRYQDKTYRYIPHGTRSGTHELATELATIDDRVSYPTFLIIDADGETPIRYNTFLSASAMTDTLTTAINN